MKKSNWILIGILVVLGLIIYQTFSGSYNKMVTMNETVESAWSTVETQYQRRTDLYNSVVSTIQGSKEFEQETLTQVIEARSKATGINIDANNLTPEKVQQFQNAQNELSGAFSRLMVSVERYPELQTTQAFRDFQTQIEGTENRINKARNDFNQEVQAYNTYIKRFPSNLMAGMFGFDEKGYFKADAGSENAPEINF
ncbi:LemA family protein [Membranihabitans maritimus]|uniref:LemA family protein n=1 Tax=Membranihabitans maritimus TaxID=2904244 RepID=UPI001F220481|nr:LemA family protein [Membranihabitans maritimus]